MTSTKPMSQWTESQREHRRKKERRRYADKLEQMRAAGVEPPKRKENKVKVFKLQAQYKLGVDNVMG